MSLIHFSPPYVANNLNGVHLVNLGWAGLHGEYHRFVNLFENQ